MKKYDAYKDSGVKWIGEIPNHWEVVPLKRTGSFENGLTYSPNDIRDKGYIVLRSSNIQNSKMNYEDTVYVESVPNDLLVKKGDIIICSRNGSASLVGKCAKFDGKIAATFGAFMMRYSPSINNEYAFFSFQILMRNYKGLFTTSTINQLTKNVIAQMVCPLPPLSEQQAIASYLDAKTEKIDKMIAKAEKKIEYLGELKQSLITRAVTRGLNPNASLKDSGVKWIGKVPEHWDQSRLQYNPLSPVGSEERGKSPRKCAPRIIQQGIDAACQRIITVIQIRLIGFVTVVRHGLVSSTDGHQPHLFTEREPRTVIPVAQPVHADNTDGIRRAGHVVNHLPIGFQRFQLTGKRYTLTDGIDSKTYGTGVLVVKHKTDIPQTGSRIDIFPLLRITRQDTADVLHTNQ